MVQEIQRKRTTSSVSCTVQYTISKTVASTCLLVTFVSCVSAPPQKRFQRFPQPKQEQPFEQKKTSQSLNQGIKLFNQKKYPEALQVFEQDTSNKSDSTYSQIQFYKGLTLYRMKQYKKSFEQLNSIITESPHEKWITQSSVLQWKILSDHLEVKDFYKLQVLSQIIQHSSSITVKTKARDQALSLIEKLEPLDLKSFVEDESLSGIQDILLFHLARHYVKNKSYQKALSLFKKLSNQPINNVQIENQTQQYIQALTFRTKVSPKTIATILPLTGKYQNIGRRCLNGLQLGLGLFDPQPSLFKLIVKDSKSSSLSTQEHIKDILFKHQAIGLIGGVVSQSAIKLAQEAQNFMIPAILLSQKSQLTQYGEFIFQNAITNEYIIKNLVDTLMSLDHKNLAILYPNDPFGVEYANLFWNHVENKGGQIVAAQTYKTDETDFNNAIRRLTGTYYMEDRDEEFRETLKEKFSQDTQKRNKTKLREILPPVINFSALFIPDSIESLHRISPYLKSQGIKEVIFTGPSFWNSPRLLQQKKNLIEGALFVDALITNHPDFKKSSFFQNFKTTFNQEPGLFEFLAYQSALALRQAISTGIENREDLRKYLSQTKKLSSPIGQVKMSANRQFIYPITQFSVKNSTITPFHSAP